MTDPNNSSAAHIKKSFLQGYSKQDLVVIIQTTLSKAQDKHQESRKWEARALAAEAELEAVRASGEQP